MMNKLEKIKEGFANTALFEQALTHRSWINENPGIRQHNERLEFLGDAILEFIVSEAIYAHLPNREEGYLTSLRASLVNTQNLSQVAAKLDIGSHLYLSRGEDDGGGRGNPSLLADTVEALIGALYLDSGLEAVKKFIDQNILINLEDKISQPLKDPKSRLQEQVQAAGQPTPKYHVTAEDGPDHNKTFKVQVWVGSNQRGEGSGHSKAVAETNAALAALGEK